LIYFNAGTEGGTSFKAGRGRRSLKKKKRGERVEISPFDDGGREGQWDVRKGPLGVTKGEREDAQLSQRGRSQRSRYRGGRTNPVNGRGKKGGGKGTGMYGGDPSAYPKKEGIRQGTKKIQKKGGRSAALKKKVGGNTRRGKELGRLGRKELLHGGGWGKRVPRMKGG